nr:tail fiber domain-containing protein [uncultured Janthinobacterium sp.]
MANYFYDGMPNVNERLNQLYNAFAAGPYNALPLTGGMLSGPVKSTSSYSGNSFTAGDPQSYCQTSIIAPPIQGEPGVAYDILRIGVPGVLGAGYPGNFTWQTRCGGASVFAAGYTMSLYARDIESSADTGMLLSISGTGEFYVAGSIKAANVVPDLDNGRTIGTAAKAYSTLYARTGTINTSDARLKTNFRDLAPAEIAAARDLARAIGVYRWRDAVECKGDGAREHIGPTVQRAIEIMQAHGLEPFNYGFICHDEWEQQTVEHPAIKARPAVPSSEAVPAVLDSLGNVVTPAVVASPGLPAVDARAAYTEVTLEAGDRYAFRYDELAMFIAAGQEARLAALEVA